MKSWHTDQVTGKINWVSSLQAQALNSFMLFKKECFVEMVPHFSISLQIKIILWSYIISSSLLLLPYLTFSLKKKKSVGTTVTKVGTGAMKITCLCSVCSPALKCKLSVQLWEDFLKSSMIISVFFYSVWVLYWYQQYRRNGSEINWMCRQKFLLEKWGLSTTKSITTLSLRTLRTQTTQTFKL